MHVRTDFPLEKTLPEPHNFSSVKICALWYIMDIPSWSFTNIGKSMMTSSCIIEHKIIKKPENPPETTTTYDKIEDFLLNFIDLGFDVNLDLFIELYL